MMMMMMTALMMMPKIIITITAAASQMDKSVCAIIRFTRLLQRRFISDLNDMLMPQIKG